MTDEQFEQPKVAVCRMRTIICTFLYLQQRKRFLFGVLVRTRRMMVIIKNTLRDHFHPFSSYKYEYELLNKLLLLLPYLWHLWNLRVHPHKIDETDYCHVNGFKLKLITLQLC